MSTRQLLLTQVSNNDAVLRHPGVQLLRSGRHKSFHGFPQRRSFGSIYWVGTVKGVKCDALLPNSCQQQLQSLLRHSKCVPTVKSSVKRNVRIFTSSTVKDVYIHSSKNEYRLQNLPIVIRQKTRNNLNLYFFFYFNSKFQMAKKFTVQRNIKRSC